MKNILVLGAGQSTPFLISYLLKESESHDWFVTVCDMDFELAQSRVNGNPNGTALKFDVNDANLRTTLIDKSDIVINMLAPYFQYIIAVDCVNLGKHCITASYADIQIPNLELEAQRKGILILNEMGLDPGIDHMSAMAMINEVRANGGYVTSFISYGSGIPAPEVQSNPLNYCITWNPRNVVLAGQTGAQYLEERNLKIVSHHQVFQRTWNVELDGVGTFEAYPNRDSLIYQEIFNLKRVNTMIRGTLRYPGWSETWLQIVRLGLTNEFAKMPFLNQMTYSKFLEMFLPLTISGTNIEPRVANFLGINPTGKIMSNLRWLGLFSNEKIPGDPQTPVDVMVDLVKRKMPLPAGERDMVILLHKIEAQYPEENDRKELIESCLIEYGEANGFTAISKTVGLPAAIAAKLILTDELILTGCHIPTHPAIYTKVLAELESLGLKFDEKRFEVHS